MKRVSISKVMVFGVLHIFFIRTCEFLGADDCSYMFASFQPYLCLTRTYSRLVKRALSVVIDHDYCYTNQQWQKKSRGKHYRLNK